MQAQKFNEILERRIELTRKVLSSKAKEYATDENALGYDRLHNFNRAAEMLRVSRERALVGMLTKHLVSILDIVDKFNYDKPSFEMVEEKIGDSINYLILLEAAMKEDIEDIGTVSDIINKEVVAFKKSKAKK